MITQYSFCFVFQCDIKLTWTVLSMLRRRKSKDLQGKGSICTVEEYLKLKITVSYIEVAIFNTNVMTVILYGAETWWTITIIIKGVQVFINEWLRKILNVHWSVTISNSLVWKRTNEFLVDEEISKRYWRWMGYTLWKPSNCTTR